MKYKILILIRKLTTLLFNTYCLIKKTSRLPSQAIIDPIDFCNLKCPLCPTGNAILPEKRSIMNIKTYKKILKKIPSLKIVYLYNWGEPLLNPDIFEMIKYSYKLDIDTVIHTNLSFVKNRSFFSKLINSQITKIVVSIDGASQTTYSTYRKNGDFNLVIKNLKLLSKLNQDQSLNVEIVWKFIVNRFNEHELKKAKTMASEIGVKFVTTGIGLGNDLPDCEFKETLELRQQKWLPKQKKFVTPHSKPTQKSPLFNLPCPYLFDSINISPKGFVYPCCLAFNPSSAFGNITKQSLVRIWTNHKYLNSRLAQKRIEINTKHKTICTECNNYIRVK